MLAGVLSNSVLSTFGRENSPASEGPCPEDTRDIAGALRGDESAFASLVRRYESGVYAQMCRFSRDPGTCRELVQDVFVEVYLSLKSYRGDAPFVHWLRRIATRVGYRYWGRETRQRRLRDAMQQVVQGGGGTRQESPSDAADLLFEILSHLEQKDRLVLTLYYFEGCASGEIAGRMGWSETLVRVRMHRARHRLRKLVEERPHWREAL